MLELIQHLNLLDLNFLLLVMILLFSVLTSICRCSIEDLFYCAPAWSKTCLFFCQQFLSLGLESVEDNSEHYLAGMVD